MSLKRFDELLAGLWLCGRGLWRLAVLAAGSVMGVERCVRCSRRPGAMPRRSVASAAQASAMPAGAATLRVSSGEARCSDGTRVECGEQSQVVEAGDAGVDEADDREPDVAGVDGCGEGVELAEEAAGEGNADQRDEEEAEQRGKHGAAQREAGVVVERARFFAVAGDGGEDEEGADVHRGVGSGVEERGGDGVLAGGS